MDSTTLTSKGQMTLPKSVRDRFDLKAGDKINVLVEDGRIVLVPATLSLEELTNILPRSKKRVTLEEMGEAVRRRAVGRR